MAGTVHDVENKDLLAQVKAESADAARQLADAAKLHKGQIVEHGDADQIMQNPQNPYTQKLLASLPVPDPREQRKHREHLHELLAAQQ